jgi:hypothetical protein
MTQSGVCFLAHWDQPLCTGSMARGILEVGQKVRLKTALEAPANIPAGATGLAVRVSDWDVWVRFDGGVVRLTMGEVEHI